MTREEMAYWSAVEIERRVYNSMALEGQTEGLSETFRQDLVERTARRVLRGWDRKDWVEVIRQAKLIHANKVARQENQVE